MHDPLIGLVVLMVASKTGSICRPMRLSSEVLKLLPRPMPVAE